MSEHHHHHDHDHEHSHDFTPEQELLALIHYMTHHNADHTSELRDLSLQLKDVGNISAYEKVLSAVLKFEEGTELLEEAMDLMQ